LTVVPTQRVYCLVIATLLLGMTACSLSRRPMEALSPGTVQWDLDWAEGATFCVVPVDSLPTTDSGRPLGELASKLDALNDGDPSTAGDLGVDGLCITPSLAASSADRDPEIEPDLATLEELRALVEAAHSRGMRVIMDLGLDPTDSAAADRALWWLESGLDGLRLVSMCPEGSVNRLSSWQRVSEAVRQHRRDALLVGWCEGRQPTIAAHFGSTRRLRRGDALPTMLRLRLSAAIETTVREGTAGTLRSALEELNGNAPAGPLHAVHVDSSSAPITAAAIAMSLPGPVLLGERIASATPGLWWLPEATTGPDASDRRLRDAIRQVACARSGSPALRHGVVELIPEAPHDLLLLLRRHPKQTVVVAHNLGADSITAGLKLPYMKPVELVVLGDGVATANDDGIELTIGPGSSAMWELQLQR
jgi:hypothetical protein